MIEKEFVILNYHINYQKFGLRVGLLYIYLNNGNFEVIIDRIFIIKGITSIEVHIGNSDILAGVVFNQGSDLFEIITEIKKFEGVERIDWSERILEYPHNIQDLVKLQSPLTQ